MALLSTTIEAGLEEFNGFSPYGERIVQGLTLRNKNKAWLASKLGITKQGLNYLLKHATKIKYVSEIALLLDISPGYLKTGEGALIITPSKINSYKIPLVCPDELPLKNVIKNENRTWYASDANALNSCFAIKLENTSMEPLFKIGSVLIFDASRVARSGDYIIFKLTETEEILVRHYLVDGNEVYFKAFDSMYRSIKNEAYKIFGVLIESRNIF